MTCNPVSSMPHYTSAALPWLDHQRLAVSPDPGPRAMGETRGGSNEEAS